MQKLNSFWDRVHSPLQIVRNVLDISRSILYWGQIFNWLYNKDINEFAWNIFIINARKAYKSTWLIERLLWRAGCHEAVNLQV